LLRERVAQQKQQELLDYIDQLLPVYETAKDPIAANKRRRSSYHWSEFLDFYDEYFVRNAYVVIFQREPDVSGMQSGLQALRLEKRSRIELLGRLRFSNEGNLHGVVIKGLWIRYQLARLQRLPVLGGLVGVVAKLDSLSRPDLENEALHIKIEQQKEHIGVAEQKLSAHFNQVAGNLGGSWHGSLPGKADDATGISAGGVSRPALGQILELTGAQFVQAAYHIVLGRAPLELELKSAISRFLSGKESKVLLLGKLCESKEAQMTRKDIAGLPAAYFRERLFALPVIGFFLQLPRAVLMLNRANIILEFQQSEIAECDNQVNRFESRLAGHYNDTVKHLKLKFVELVQPDSKT
jgi:hypothetical protein